MQNSSGWTWQSSTLTSDLNTSNSVSHQTFLISFSLYFSFLSRSSHSCDSEPNVCVPNVHLWNGSLCLLQAGGDEKDALIEGTDGIHANLILLMYTDGLTNQMQALFHPKKDKAFHISSISSPQRSLNEIKYTLQAQLTRWNVFLLYVIMQI